ncbi:uncharacterized protein N7479_006122 [Penicillium vulpinum]|uniref:uncharacterized protein n=1 Tax=Penicillium vulpinum TaxID=29845 RepID=UPI002547877A|nr:uncharacterized protein N7479_006122 [Penicillium vulpinum]KAJ5958972.1 hypothetical protein N7479_006122 [Penicillium vulpinum]
MPNRPQLELWYRAAREINQLLLRHCHHGISVEIIETDLFNGNYCSPVESSHSIFPKWKNLAQEIVAHYSNNNDWIGLNCFRYGTNPRRSSNPVTVIIRVRKTCRNPFVTEARYIHDILAASGEAEVDVLFTKDATKSFVLNSTVPREATTGSVYPGVSIGVYKTGGYHPVHLGDLFNQRYEIVGKWSYGQFSTVWLAKDNRLQRDVTLKILKATASEKSKELSILTELSQLSISHPGKEHVLSLLDHFAHNGPNGSHLCLVFPSMLSDGEAMTARGKARDVTFVRTVSTQIILGLEFLHELNFIHSDLHPANILFNTNQIKLQNVLMPPEFSPVRWLPGIEVDSSALQYLMISQRPYGMLDDTNASCLMVKIGDFGGAWPTIAFQSNDKNSLPMTPFGMRAPEMLNGRSLDSKIDIWALGCLIFQLATNEPLFPLMTFGCTNEECRANLSDLVTQATGNGYVGFAAHLRERLQSDFGAENREKFASFL